MNAENRPNTSVKERLERALFTAGVGAIGGAVAYFSYGSWIQPDEASQRASITACADELGSEPTDALGVPIPCAENAYVFPYTKIEREVSDGINRRTNVSLVYHLPARDSFVSYRESLIVPNEVRNKGRLGLTGAVGGFCVVAWSLLSVSGRRANERLLENRQETGQLTLFDPAAYMQR